jgi:hypothetical protein
MGNKCLTDHLVILMKTRFLVSMLIIVALIIFYLDINIRFSLSLKSHLNFDLIKKWNRSNRI